MTDTLNYVKAAKIDGGQDTVPGPQRKRLERLAWFLDSAIPLPGGFSIGLDGIIGLIPGFGDAAAALVSSYIIAQGARAGAPKSVLARMLGNVALETAIGAIPLAGDLFDIAFKANQRNVILLQHFLDRPATTERASRGFLLAVVAAIVAILAGGIYLSVLLFGWLLGLLV